MALQRDPGQAASPARYLSVGLTWAASTGLFLFLGSLADGRLGTEPWFTLIGAFVGASAGLYHMIRQLSPAKSARKEDG